MTRGELTQAHLSACITLTIIDAQLASAQDPHLRGGLELRRRAIEARKMRALAALEKERIA